MSVECSLDNIAKLSRVTLGERNLLESFDRIIRKLDLCPELGGHDLGEPTRLGFDIFRAIAKRRHGQEETLNTG